MSTAKKSDDEIIAFIIHAIYSNNHYSYIPLDYVKEELPNEHPFDINRLWDKTISLGLTKTMTLGTDDKILMLSDKGMEIMRQYKDYLTYLQYLKKQEIKKEKTENIDRNIKNGNIIVALMVSVFGLVISQRPSAEKEQQTQLKEEVKHLSGRLDSLIQVAKHDKTSKPK